MNVINEYNFAPGVYEHHTGLIFVALDLITHYENAEVGDVLKLDEPEVLYRDLMVPTQHFEGKLMGIHRRYRMKLSEWNMVMPDGKKRFKAI